jgi:hypothetical protein
MNLKAPAARGEQGGWEWETERQGVEENMALILFSALTFSMIKMLLHHYI